MLTIFTREELYELVWSTPRQKLAKELEFSDVAIGKACRRAGVPVPPRGYWARLKAGRKCAKIPLSPRFPGAPNEIQLGGRKSWGRPVPSLGAPLPPPPEFPEELEVVRSRAKDLVGRVRHPQLAEQLHPLIAKLLMHDEERAKNYATYPSEWNMPRYATSLQRRRIRIMNSIFIATQRLGGQAWIATSPYEDNDRDASLRLGDSILKIRVEELAATKSSRHKVDKLSKRLRLSILSISDEACVQKLWHDEQRSRIESSLNQIMTELLVAAELLYRGNQLRRYQYVLERRAKLEEEERQRILLEQKEAQEWFESRKQESLKRLLDQATALAEAETIRRFVSKARSRRNELPATAQKALERWTKWALRIAAQRDPIENGELLSTFD